VQLSDSIRGVSYSASQKLPRTLLNTKVYYRIHGVGTKSEPHPSHVKLFHDLLPHFLKVLLSMNLTLSLLSHIHFPIPTPSVILLTTYTPPFVVSFSQSPNYRIALCRLPKPFIQCTCTFTPFLETICSLRTPRTQRGLRKLRVYKKMQLVNEKYKLITRIRDFTLSLRFNNQFH
jgi:hypothetical protein